MLSCILAKVYDSAELETFRADVTEGNAKLERLQEKMQELAAQKQDANKAIEEGRRLIHIQKNSTRAELFKLKGCCGKYVHLLRSNGFVRR